MTTQKILTWIALLLSLAGIILASYLTWVHYNPPLPGEEVFGCYAGSSCGAVNSSEYAVFLGIPVAIIGTLGYLIIFIMSILIIWKNKQNLVFWIFLISLIGFLFQSYLTYISGTIIRAYCSLCLTSEAIIFLILLCSFFLAKPQLKEIWNKYVD